MQTGLEIIDRNLGKSANFSYFLRSVEVMRNFQRNPFIFHYS